MFAKVQPGQDFSPPSAFEWNAMLTAGQLALAGKYGVSAQIQACATSPQACVVRIKNTSGSDRNRYECLSLGEPRWELSAAHTLLSIIIAGTAGPNNPAVLLQPLKVDQIGLATILGPTLLRMNAFAGAAKQYAAPNANGKFDSADSGPIQLLGAVSGEFGFGILVGRKAGSILAKTPIGGIPAMTGTGPYTWGSADCTPINEDGTVGSGTVTIKNIVTDSIAGEVVIKANLVGAVYVVDTASCGS